MQRVIRSQSVILRLLWISLFLLPQVTLQAQLIADDPITGQVESAEISTEEGNQSLPLDQDEKFAIDQAKALSKAFRRAAKVAGPSVVTIVTQTVTIETIRESGRFVERLVPEDSSIGSGVVIHSSGIVLTNSHVLEGADRIIVRTADGREFPTYDVRRDVRSDVAILRMKDPPKLKSARMGDSNEVSVGDWVIAIGNPFEFDTTVSAGIISGKNRMLEKIQRGKLLQTDAAINPGNSGGPLVNLEGEVIGINTAIASSSGGYQGVGFAIPINNARWVVNQLAKHGEVQRGYLGVKSEKFTPADAVRANLPPMAGVRVMKVYPATSAERAGIQANDVIIEFAGMRIRDQRDLQGAVERKPIGSKQTVKIIRNGQTERLDVVIQRMPSN